MIIEKNINIPFLIISSLYLYKSFYLFNDITENLHKSIIKVP